MINLKARVSTRRDAFEISCSQVVQKKGHTGEDEGSLAEFGGKEPGAQVDYRGGGSIRQAVPPEYVRCVQDTEADYDGSNETTSHAKNSVRTRLNMAYRHQY